MAKKNAKYPTTIYVQEENDGDDSYYAILESTDYSKNGEQFAVYEYVGVATAKVTRSLTDPK